MSLLFFQSFIPKKVQLIFLLFIVVALRYIHQDWNIWKYDSEINCLSKETQIIKNGLYIRGPTISPDDDCTYKQLKNSRYCTITVTPLRYTLYQYWLIENLFLLKSVIIGDHLHKQVVVYFSLDKPTDSSPRLYPHPTKTPPASQRSMSSPPTKALQAPSHSRT